MEVQILPLGPCRDGESIACLFNTGRLEVQVLLTAPFNSETGVIMKDDHTLLCDMKVYEILKIVKENGDIEIQLTGPLVGMIREHVNGKDMVQLKDNRMVATISKDKLIFTTDNL